MKKNIVVIGGGTGTVAVLSGLKKQKNLNLKVIVNMTDDGGSNKVVRDEFGLLPLSDLRKSIIALSKTGNGVLRQLFTYRFDKGAGFSGHTLGNIIMMALSDITGSEKKAVAAASKIFEVNGEIIPVTYDHTRLHAFFSDNTELVGEHLIDENSKNSTAKIINFSVTPTAQANPDAINAIETADYIIIGPGDLYTSTLANMVISGITSAIKNSKAKVILITNLITKPGETHWMTLTDFVTEVSRYCERTPEYLLVNNAKYSPEILKYYEEEDSYPFQDDLKETDNSVIIRANLLTKHKSTTEKGDLLKRSLIRHDPQKIAKQLLKIFTI